MKLTDKEKKTENRTDELLEEYKYLVKEKAGLYFMLGGDKEDIIQEGMIGLFKAIQSYDASKGASFKTYADICINTQIISAIKAANRKKLSPLNSAVSIDRSISDDDDSVSLKDSLVANSDTNPETLALYKDMISMLLSPDAKLLSALEQTVLRGLIAGKKYTEIAAEMKKSPKQIDNTIQRIRAKLKRFFV